MMKKTIISKLKNEFIFSKKFMKLTLGYRNGQGNGDSSGWSGPIHNTLWSSQFVALGVKIILFCGGTWKVFGCRRKFLDFR
jgi:hypothetical protein